MKLLLDTHVFLWLISDDQQLSRSYRQAISDPANEVFLSVVSVWEAVIKHAIGRLPLPALPGKYLPAQRRRHGIESLELSEDCIEVLEGLPLIHRDPFDRMLICQAVDRDLTIVTSDRVFESYGVQLFNL